MKVKPPVFILILILTLISALYMNVVVVRPNVDLLIEHEDKILSGQMDAPYQYRVFQPMISRVVQELLASSFSSGVCVLSSTAAHLMAPTSIPS